MKISVEIDSAKQQILESINRVKAGWTPTKTPMQNKIKEVILGTHLTFRYILYTGIVAKVTNSDANPLTLQVGSTLEGAYDARSVCHKAIVPIEREYLEGRLGESNEPFLNKPARYKDLSTDNPVRKGNDKDTLNTVIEILSSIDEKNKISYLDTATFYIFQRSNKTVVVAPSNKHNNHQDTIIFIRNLLSVSNEGQSSVIAVGAALSFLTSVFSNKIKTKIHPVNQAGSSSNEIGDIDICMNKIALCALEIKDKNYNKHDVEHAATKALNSGLQYLIFVEGQNGKPQEKMDKTQQNFEEKGFTLIFISAEKLINLILALTGNPSTHNYAVKCLEICKEARVKDETFQRVKKLFDSLGQ